MKYCPTCSQVVLKADFDNDIYNKNSISDIVNGEVKYYAKNFLDEYLNTQVFLRLIGPVTFEDDTKEKYGYCSPFNRLNFAIENPELTYSVNRTQTAYGIVDILMHTLERYFQPSSENEPCDGFAETLLKSVIEAGPKAMENPNDYDSRAVLMLMSSLSHNGLMNIGKKPGMPVHALEHALSGVYPFVAHGAGLAVLFPMWARFYIPYDVDKFDRFARNVFNLTNEDKMQNAKDGIDKLDEFFTSLSMPKTFKDLGINDVDIDKLVKVLTQDGTRVIGHHVKPIDQDVAYSIYKMCI